MFLPNTVPITYDAFRAAVDREQCGTRSKHARPLIDERAWQGECSVDEFLALEAYPVWYVGPEGGSGQFWDSRHHFRIRFREALQRADFRTEFSVDRQPTVPFSKGAPLIVLHCLTCGHAAVIDGNHRLTRLVLGLDNRNDFALVFVFGLSGSRWDRSVPDMNVICACIAP
jgi:hypothetical protein